MPHAILIDWDQTLSTSRFWHTWQTEAPDAFAWLQQSFFGGAQRELIHDWMRGRCSSEKIAELIGRSTGLSPVIVIRDLQRSCEQMTFLEPAILEAVSTLRATGSIVAIATDNMDTFTRWTVPALQLTNHFDTILNSADIGILKTDVGPGSSLPFFAAFLSQHRLLPSECVIIDDGKSLEWPALAAGFQYRLVSSSETALHHLRNIA